MARLTRAKLFSKPRRANSYDELRSTEEPVIANIPSLELVVVRYPIGSDIPRSSLVMIMPVRTESFIVLRPPSAARPRTMRTLIRVLRRRK